MRDKFPGYYRPSEKEFIDMWKQCTFVFDANVLLDLFRVSSNTAQSILKTLGKLKDRVWLPHQAAEEYHRNLAGVLAEQQKTYQATLNEIENLLDSFRRERRHPFIDSGLMSEVDSLFEKVRSELEKSRDSLANAFIDHPLKDDIANLFVAKVGDKFDIDRLAEIFRDGEERYRNRVPPGYEDRDKEPEIRKYGDLVMWLQILDKVKSTDEGMIFVTNDVKEDWFLRVSGKTLGPRPELVAELKRRKDVQFYIYTTEEFLRFANDHLNADIHEEMIEEFKEIDHSAEYDYPSSYLRSITAGNNTLLHVLGTLSQLPQNQIQDFKEAVAQIRASEDKSLQETTLELRMWELQPIARVLSRISPRASVDIQRAIFELPPEDLHKLQNLMSRLPLEDFVKLTTVLSHVKFGDVRNIQRIAPLLPLSALRELARLSGSTGPDRLG